MKTWPQALPEVRDSADLKHHFAGDSRSEERSSDDAAARATTIARPRRDRLRELGEPVLHGRDPLHQGMEIEDTLVMNLAHDHEVVQLPAAGAS